MFCQWGTCKSFDSSRLEQLGFDFIAAPSEHYEITPDLIVVRFILIVTVKKAQGWQVRNFAFMEKQ